MDGDQLINLAFLRESLTAILGEHKKLAARVAALESRRLLAYAGPHDVSKSYVSGDCVQRGGALHVALIDTSETPGSSGHWRELARAKP
jgi:hypothetical protein